MNKYNRRIFLPTIIAACSLNSSYIQAQGPEELNEVAQPGTEPQRAAAAGIVKVCPTLVAGVDNGTITDPLTINLQQICTAMVHTANVQQGFDPEGFPEDLGINGPQLLEVLQTIAHEETAAQSGGVVEIEGGGDIDAVGARLAALRAGATGIQLSSMQFNLQGVAFTAADLVSGERGGSAGDEEIGGPLGAFLNGSYYWGDKDATSRENAFDFDNFGVVGGVDYRFTDNWVGGVAINYSQTNVDFETGPGGDSDTDTYGGSLYGSYYVSNFYLDAHANYSRNEFDTTRQIVIPSPANQQIDLIDGVDDGVLRGTASGETDGNQYTIGLGAGYNLGSGGLTTTPYARLEYINLDIDGYSETDPVGLALEVDDQSVTSLQSALGAQLAYALSIETGVLVPQVYAEWNHEFENDSEAITARYVNDPFNLSDFAIPTEDPDEDFFTIGASVAATFRNGLQGFVAFETVEGLSDITNRGVTGGMRLEF